MSEDDEGWSDENWDDMDTRSDEERRSSVQFLKKEMLRTIHRCGYEARLTVDDLIFVLTTISYDTLNVDRELDDEETEQ